MINLSLHLDALAPAQIVVRTTKSKHEIPTPVIELAGPENVLRGDLRLGR